MNITRAVIPVAGLGTRFLPASKVVPKELFPLLNKPVIQHTVEELHQAGITEIIFVINKSKRAIEHHFAPHRELEQLLSERGKDDLLKEIRRLEDMATFRYVEQNQPLGDGHALLCAEQLLRNEPCIVIFGDTLMEAQPSMTIQLLQAHTKCSGSIIAVAPVAHEDVSQYGIVAGNTAEPLFEITDMIEKPFARNAPSNLAIIGSYIVTPAVLEALKQHPDGSGEVRLIDGFRAVQPTEKIYGLQVSGTWLDTGNYLGFLKASIHLALQNKQLQAPLRVYLKSIEI